ncbi:MAG: TolC family protein [Kangiellaceae bacterium]|jgi:outer membrane protein TolC|nr:TolC family protein [Kangiellaceae bacterium]
MKGYIAALFLLATVTSSSIFANAVPTVDDVIQSIMNHHPRMSELQSKGKQIDFERQKAVGAFDPIISQDTFAYGAGFYDGSSLSQQINKPLENLNAEVYGGYRLSDGLFPEYYSEFETLNNGEAFIGMKFSLLQNSDIDERRMALQNAEIAIKQWRSEQQYYLNALIRQGVNSYLDWYQALNSYLLLNDLYITTKQRMSAIQTRVKNGDLAQIAITEFNTILLNREAMLLQARNTLGILAEALTYFLRDEKGEPIDPNVLLEISGIKNNFNIYDQASLKWPSKNMPSDKQSEKLVLAHPLLQALRMSQQQAQNKLTLAENQLRPQLDFSIKAAQDIGNGPSSLDGTEATIGINFSVPLEQNTAKAERAIAKEKNRELSFAYTALSQEIERDLIIAKVKYDNLINIAKVQQEQAAMTRELMRQETIRFEAGASDLFLLNSRETSAIQNNLKMVKADIDVLKSQLEYWYKIGQVNCLFALESDSCGL